MLTNVFEIRKKLIEAYGQFEYIIVPAFKFVVAFLLILMINSHIGFNLGLTNKLLGKWRRRCARPRRTSISRRRRSCGTA